MATKEKKKEKNYLDIEPRFRNPATMTAEELTDPDYALKQLEKLNGGKLKITCSKCHCR